MWPKLTRFYSPNFSVPKRAKKNIKFIILHYTGMSNEKLAIKKLCDFNSKVSAHYFIKKNGNILNLVPDLYEAWHAGVSSWKRLTSINKYSIGIEIQNSGHNFNYENFSLRQINSLKKLLKNLIKIYKINYKNILGHSDIAPNRKKDPGEKFPWEKLSKEKLALWYNLNRKELKKSRLIKLRLKEKKFFLNNLYKLGYCKIKKSKQNYNDRSLINAFQRRFRQNLVNGIVDKECLIISKNLLE